MEFVSFEIIGPLTSPAVLLSGVALALVFLSGIAAKTLQLIEDLRYRRQARIRTSQPVGVRHRAHRPLEIGIVR